MAGAGITVGRSVNGRITVAFPYDPDLLPLPEQKKIAGILGAVDKRIELEGRRTGKLELVKQGLMNDLLTGRKKVENGEG